MTRPNTSHPAKFPRYVLDRIAMQLGPESRQRGRPVRVLDPFAGIGRVHDLPRRLADTTGIEIEPEWAACRRRTIVGDATRLPFGSGSFDVVTTSPCYGNRLADHHEARDSCATCGGTGVIATTTGCSDAPWSCIACGRVDCVCGVLAKAMREHNATCRTCRGLRCQACSGSGLSRRYTYRHALRRMPHERSAATMQWGGHYRSLHGMAIDEWRRVLVDDGLVLVNVKNHVRGGHEQHVTRWWANRLGEAGIEVLRIDDLEAPGLRHGANAQLRVEHERLIVARCA